MNRTDTLEKISRRCIRQAIREQYRKSLAAALRLPSTAPSTPPPAASPAAPVHAPLPADGEAEARALLHLRSMPVYDVRCLYADDSPTPRLCQIGSIALPLCYAEATMAVLRMRGGSMAPILRDGAYVGVAPTPESEKVVPGKLYAVFSPSEGLLIRRVCHLGKEDSAGKNGGEEGCVLRAGAPGYPEIPLAPHLLRRRLYGRIVWVLQFHSADALHG